MVNRKRVLIFNGYFTPAKNYGGPLTSCKNVIKTCSDEFDFFVVSRNHDVGCKDIFPNLHKGWKLVEGAMVKYIADGELDFDKSSLRDLFLEVKPDLIWFAGILMPNIRLKTIVLSKELKIPVLLSPRGEVSNDRIQLKWWKKKPYLFFTKMLGYYRDTYFHATCNDEVAGLKKYVGASAKKIFLIPNIGVPLGPFRQECNKKQGELRVVFIARIHMVKNVKLAIEVVCKMKSKVTFDIYGPLEQPEYWDECLQVIKTAPGNVTVNYCGQLLPMDVGACFRKYDCFLFPTLNENYGHSIAESLANGIPVVLSKDTTPWNTINKKAGYVCSLSNVDEFTSALENIAALNKDSYQKLQSDVRVYYKSVLLKDNAIKGHKEMFRSIILDYSKKNN